MEKYYLTVLFTFVCVFGLGHARAQDEDAVVAKVPHDFVVSGTVLPAGTYRVSRVEPSGQRELVIRNYETGASVILIPTVFAGAPSEHARLSLQPVGNKYFLSEIQTSNGVYTIAIPSSAIKLAQMEQQGSSASGGN
jgi:hypothetical protein